MDTKSAVAIIILSAILVTSGCTSSSLNGNGGTKKGIDWSVDKEGGDWVIILNALDYPEEADFTWKLGDETDRGTHAEFTVEDPESHRVYLDIETDEETIEKDILIPASEFMNVKITNAWIKDIKKSIGYEAGILGGSHQTHLSFQIKNNGAELEGVNVDVEVINYGNCAQDDKSHSESYNSIGYSGTAPYNHDNFCDQKDGKEISFNVNIRSEQGDSSFTITCTADKDNNCDIS